MERSNALRSWAVQNGSDEKAPDVVLVYGLSARNEAIDIRRWNATLMKLLPENSHLLNFDVNVRLDEPGAWDLSLARSGDLLEAIYTHHCQTKKSRRPLIFICHSLSGWVVKQMLFQAAQQFSRFRDIIELCSGIVFLSTPHFTRPDEESIKALSTVLRSDPSSKPLFTKKNMSSLVHTSLLFEELKMQIPVLSAYDTIATKLRGSLWGTRKVLLVPELLAKTAAPFETTVPLDVELSTVFDTGDGVFHLRLQEYMRRTCKDACTRIEQLLQAESKPAGTPALDMRSVSTADEVEQRKRSSPSSGPSRKVHSCSPEPSSTSPNAKISYSPKSMLTASSYEIVSGRSDFGGPTVNLPCRINAPYPQNKDFRGRDHELRAMHAALCPNVLAGKEQREPALKTFVVHGLAGSGKTQLGVQYIILYGDSYDAIFFISASLPEKLAAGYNRIAHKLGLASGGALDDQAANRDLVKAWLADPVKSETKFGKEYAKWLLVLDNADNPDIVLHNDFWPRDGYGSVLVTSRDPISRGKMFFGEVGMELKSLPEEEAVSLLQALLLQPRSVVDGTAENVVRRLNCWPLMIVQMAGVMLRLNLSLEAFLNIYEQEINKAQLHDLRVGTLHGYGATLSSIWSFEKFQQGPKQILSVISIFHYEAIPEEIFLTASDNPQSGMSWTKLSFSQDLQALTQSSMVSTNSEDNTLSIHPMVQDVTRAQLLRTSEAIVAAFHSSVELVCPVWPFITTPRLHPVFDQVDRYSQCERIIPHLVSMRDMYMAFDKEKQRQCASEDFAWLLAEAAFYNMERSNPAGCLKFIEAGFRLVDVAPKDLSFIRAELHGTRSSIGLEMNETETALFHIEENVAFREQTFAKDGKYTSKLGAGYSEHGRALMTCGLYTKALEMFEKSIEVRSKLPGFKRIQLFNPLYCTALVQWQQGNFEEASKLLLSALQDREVAFGRDDKTSCRTGELLYALGTVRRSQNLLDDSFDYHQRAFLQLDATVGSNHHLTAKASYTLAKHYVRLEEFDNAIILLQRACKANSRGQYYIADLARSTFQLGCVLNLQGNTIAGQDALRRAWALRTQLVPTDMRPPEQLDETAYDELVVFWSV